MISFGYACLKSVFQSLLVSLSQLPSVSLSLSVCLLISFGYACLPLPPPHLWPNRPGQ